MSIDNEDFKNDKEYVNTELPSGEVVRFNRSWGGHRFTEHEVSQLTNGMEISITTPYAKGIIGSLDWQTFKEYDFYGFAPWDAEVYSIDNAPFPTQWSGHEFTEGEESILRSGEKLLLLTRSKRTGNEFAVNLSFKMLERQDEPDSFRWGINPHFEEFDLPANEFTRKTCSFKPKFSDKVLTQDEITHVREGGMLKYTGTSKKGNEYSCNLKLELDYDRERWVLEPEFT